MTMNYQHYQILDHEHYCLHCTYGCDHKLHLIDVMRYIVSCQSCQLRLYCRFQMLQCSYQEAGMQCAYFNFQYAPHPSIHTSAL